MFINLSNHPSSNWSTEQLEATRPYGEIVDMSFPAVSATGGEEYIASLVMKYASNIISQYDPLKDVIHVMGEMCFSFALVKRLQVAGFICLASTSERVVKETGPGHKETCFNFVKFRQYDI